MLAYCDHSLVITRAKPLFLQASRERVLECQPTGFRGRRPGDVM